LTCFINYAHIKKGIAEIQVSHKLMPFWWSFQVNILRILYIVAMSLKKVNGVKECNELAKMARYRRLQNQLMNYERLYFEEKYNRYAFK
jgi:hypothetical protein